MPGPTELFLILMIVLILFGAGKLPQVFESLGTGIKKFREAQEEEDEPARDVTPPAKEIAAATVEDAHEVVSEKSAAAE